MIEQQGSQLIFSFPSPEEAARALQWLKVAVLPWLSMVSQEPGTSGPPSAPLLETQQASLEPVRSRHVVLTPERQDQIFNQKASGQDSHQRLLRAQTTLRDGVLPFSKPSQAPQPSGQPSPRQKAQAEGTFADGGDHQGAGRRPPKQLSPKPSKS